MSWNPLIHDCDGCGRKRGQPCPDGSYCGERLIAADRHRASTAMASFVIEASSNPLCYDCPDCDMKRGQPCKTLAGTRRQRGYCRGRVSRANEAVAKSKAERTKVHAILPWSCGVHRATSCELDPSKGREAMLATAWGACMGSQYVSRIVLNNGDEEFELWNERDGWKEAVCSV